MSNIRTDQVSLLQVLRMLGVGTFNKGVGEIGLMEGQTKTDGRSYNETENFVKDFTGKGRAEGGPFNFVKNYLVLSDKETYQRFEDKFPSIKPAGYDNTKKTVKQIRDGLQDLNITQKEYLKSRGIDYNKINFCVKNYNDSIACLVYKGILPSGINGRTLSDDHKKRFTALSGYSTTGLYLHEIDKSKKYLYVVEGLIDFLTVRQFETNVVGLKSNESGIDDIIELSKTYQIKIIFDNDEAGKITKEKLKTIKYQFFNRKVTGQYEGKDINDFYKNIGYEGLIDCIENCMIDEVPILSTIDKFRERQKLIKEQGQLGIKGPYDFFNYTQGIVRKKVYTIGAFSNTGKSKMAYNLCSEFLKMGLNCLYISIEESEEDMFGNIACAYQNHNLLDLENIQIQDRNYYHLVLSDTTRKTTDIDIAIKQHKPDIVFIDYIQGIQGKGSGYEKNAEIALSIQTMAIENDVTIFGLAQLSNSTQRDIKFGTEGTTVMLKGAGEYYAASDVIFILLRDEDDQQGNKITMKIEKNKLGKRNIMFDVAIDYERNQFRYTEKKSFYSKI